MKRNTVVCLSLITLVASLSPAAYAQTFTVLHNFTSEWDGGVPNSGVTIDTMRIGDVVTDAGPVEFSTCVLFK